MPSLDIVIEKLEIDGKHYRVEATIGYSFENDGIGSYEYWGAKGFDKGDDYAIAEEVSITAYLLVDNNEVEKVIDPILLHMIAMAIEPTVDSALEDVKPDEAQEEND